MQGNSRGFVQARKRLYLPRTGSLLSTVDVVIPCYNYARYLRGCVASLAQPEVNVSVLVIDDASSDDTAQVGKELAAPIAGLNSGGTK